MFLYRDIQWGRSATTVGFNAGDGRGYNLPEATTTDGVRNLEIASNVGIPGAFYFRVDTELLNVNCKSISCSIGIDRGSSNNYSSRQTCICFELIFTEHAVPNFDIEVFQLGKV